MRNRFSGLLIAGPFLFTGLSACNSAYGPAGANRTAEAETAAIQAEANDWFKAIAAKDLEKTLSFYAPDAQYLSAGRPAAVTPEARRALWREDYQIPGFSSDESTAKIEVARSRDLAYQRGTYVGSMQNEDGGIVTSKGKFLVVWKKQSSGKWKAIIDIDNADQ
jgi:ketosteroid isomerase-like protein